MHFLFLCVGASALQEFFSADPKAAKAAAASLEAVTLDIEGVQWLHVLSEGWAPLKGFMREKEYLECLHFEHINTEEGFVSMSVPIVLPISGEDKARLEGKTKIALKDESGKLLGTLSDPEFFDHRKEERSARTFGISADQGHPYIERIFNAGDVLVGGDIEVFERITYNDGMDQWRLTPNEIMEKFKEMETDAVFVFQVRNPVHNGHALLMQTTAEELKKQGYKKPVLWLSQLGGWTKDDDVPLKVRMEQNHAIIKNGVFGDIPVVLGIFPSPMLYGGPREVQWHALGRLRGGATHYIVGRDPAGMKHPTKNSLQPALGDDLYHQWHGQNMLKSNNFLMKGLKLLPFQFASYDSKAGKMAFFDPARKEDFISISGTKMRKMAKEGGTPPDGFMDPEGWKVLSGYYQSKQEL